MATGWQAHLNIVVEKSIHLETGSKLGDIEK